MSVDSYTYGTVEGVHRRVGWVMNNRGPFDGTSQPALSEVEAILDDVASQVHAALSNAGYPVNTKAAMTTVSAQLAAWLARINDDGAAADILMTFPLALGEQGSVSPAKYYADKFKAGLKEIEGRTIDRFGLSLSESLSSLLQSGSYKDTDGNVKKPLFTRDMTDYPGSRDLTEE